MINLNNPEPHISGVFCFKSIPIFQPNKQPEIGNMGVGLVKISESHIVRQYFVDLDRINKNYQE
jgi:hypothetical protein